MNNIVQKRVHKNGFIALMSAIILSAILFAVTIGASSTNFSARTNMLHNELKRQSRALAESCMHEALLFMTENYTYTPQVGGDTIFINSDACAITNLVYETENTTTHSKRATVWTKGNYRGAFTNLKATVSLVNPYYIGAGITPIVIQSWAEATSTS